MSTWGPGTLDSSDAQEWLQIFLVDPNLKIIAATFKYFFSNEEEYFDLVDCYGAIAACEVVAALLGQPHSELSEMIRSSLSNLSLSGFEDLPKNAYKVLEMIEDYSELADL